jgi:hypothetical protein
MALSQISELEMELIEAVSSGQTIDFRERKDARGKPAVASIRAEVLQHLLIGLPLPVQALDQNAPTIQYAVASGSLSLLGASITGTLDIADCQHKGNAFPALLLEDCLLLGSGSYANPSTRPVASLNVQHARLARLSLVNCRAGFIDITDAVLLGDLDLTGLQALDLHSLNN